MRYFVAVWSGEEEMVESSLSRCDRVSGASTEYRVRKWEKRRL